MRVLFVAAYVPSLIRVRAYNFVRFLAKQGVQVEVAALSSGSDDEQAAAALRAAGIPTWTVPLERHDSLVNCLRALPTRLPLQAAYCFSPAMESLLRKLVASGRFDVAHVEHLRAAHFGSALGTLPAVYDAVDSLALLQARTLCGGIPSARLVAALELPRTRRYETTVARQYRRTLVCSTVDRDCLLERDPELPLTVLPNGVDLDYFQPGSTDPVSDGTTPAETIVLTGKMSYHANVAAAHYLVRKIMPIVWQARPEARVCIVGSNPPRSVDALASERVLVTGRVPDLREYLARATVAVCPVEVKAGIQNKILEAMAMGVPVVSSVRGIEGLEVQPGTDLLVGHDAAEQAAAIVRALESPETRRHLAGRGRAYVERHHDWDVNVRELQRIYEAAIEQAPRVALVQAELPGDRRAREERRWTA